jgi:hypothetical protein
MSDTEESSSSSSSSDESDVQKEEVDLAEVKLQQMRRKARSKAEARMGGGNQRMKGLQSYEEMQREHGLKRMQQGLRDLLALHTPPELSSVCGVLELSVKEKASTSIKLIVDYASEGGTLDPDRTRDLLEKLWEGAMFEYLRNIGHPAITMFVDPRETILKIWKEGGMIGTGDFIPHFVAREVKKRYEWVTSPDVEEKLIELREVQEKVKKTEKEMLTGHDFTYVLAYLKQMNQLRGLENSCREYVVGQLEIARSRVDSQKETQAMMLDDLKECEDKLISLTGNVSDKLAYCETMAETYMTENLQVESDLQRMIDIVESYIEAEEDRAEAGGGTAQALSMRHLDLSRQSMKNLHRKLQIYRNMRDEHDEELRDRARAHIEEIERLEKSVRDIEHRLEYMTRDAKTHEFYRIQAENDVRFCAKKMLKMALNKQAGVQESWAFGMRKQVQVRETDQKNLQVKALIIAALKDSTDIVVKFGEGLNEIMKLLSAEELREVDENVAMHRADRSSAKYRKFLRDQEKAKKKGPKKTVASKSSDKKATTTKSEPDSGDESKASSRASKTTKGKKGGDKKKKKKK